jgi:hypothetical protein
VRELGAEYYTGQSHAAQAVEALQDYTLAHARPDRDVKDALFILAAAVGRLAVTTWMIALKNRLGHYPSPEEWAAELDSFEMLKLSQQQDDEDDGEASS